MPLSKLMLAWELAKVTLDIVRAIRDISAGKTSKRYVRYKDIDFKIKRKLEQ